MSIKKLNSELKRLVEGYDMVENITPSEYEKEVENIIDNEFMLIQKKLFDITKKFKETNDYTSYDLPKADRALDAMAECTGIIKDILDGVSRDKGTEKKIRKALGYNG